MTAVDDDHESGWCFFAAAAAVVVVVDEAAAVAGGYGNGYGNDDVQRPPLPQLALELQQRPHQEQI